MERIDMNKLLAEIDTQEMFCDLGSDDFVNGEFQVYHNLAKFIKPKSVLEIGVYKGQSACSIIYGAKDSIEKYVGVDAEKYLENSNLIATVHLTKFLEKNKIKLSEWKILLFDTQVNGVPPELENNIFDWVHIDAGHESSEAVRDIRNFWPLTGKVMTVHDYTSHSEVKWGVDRVIEDSQIDYSNFIVFSSSHSFAAFFK